MVLNFQKPADSSTAAPVLPAIPQLPPIANAGDTRGAAGIIPISAQDKDIKPDDKKVEPAQPTGKIDVVAMEKTDRAKFVNLPPLDDVFAFPDDKQLEKVILERLREEVRRQPPDQDGKRADPFVKYPKDLTFPVNPPVGGGMAFVPKTSTYPPMRVNYDALYVVHRRCTSRRRTRSGTGGTSGSSSRSSQARTSTRTCCSCRTASPRGLLTGSGTRTPASVCPAARRRTCSTRQA